ncbi:Protein of unknown function [Gryllus bimaculatus]|nr:Protein of unknown function [Gryllus bimaculatus]
MIVTISAVLRRVPIASSAMFSISLHKGPYETIYINKLECCPVEGDTSDMLTLDLKMKGSAAGRVATGFWNAPHSVGEGVLGSVVVFQWLNGWRKTFTYEIRNDVCEDGMKTAPDLMAIIANASGVPSKCPLPKVCSA